MSDFEDRLDVVDQYMGPNITNVFIREILCKRMVIGVFESKEPGQIKATRKTYLLEVQTTHPDASINITVIMDLSQQF